MTTKRNGKGVLPTRHLVPLTYFIGIVPPCGDVNALPALIEVTQRERQSVMAYNPMWSVNAPTAVSVVVNGKWTPFFFCPMMPKIDYVMAQLIQIFNSPQFGEVRTILDANNQPLFCLGDLCRVLNLIPSKVSQRLQDGVLSRYPIADALGRLQPTNFVNEDGLYDVILDSRKPEAKQFRKWITSEVLPAIRKTGGYISDRNDETPEEIMARALQVANETLKRREERLKQLQEQNSTQQQLIAQQSEELQQAAPKVDYYDNTLQSVNTMTTTQVAKSIGIEAHTLNQKLKEAGVIFNQSGQWMLKSPFSHWSLHKTRTHMYTRSDGSTGTNIQTVWTERGRRFISVLKECGWIVSRAVKLLRGELVA